jgi:arabinogalactan endo-1,4-beta-galactosidase
VQIGNEITGGLLWTNGAVSGSSNAAWANFAQLMKAAITGVTNASGDTPPKIIIHIDRGGDWATTLWFFDNVVYQQIPFDIIGESYYPFWHGPLTNLGTCLSNAAVRYGRPVMVAETGFPWTNSYWTTNIFGIPGTTNGQAQFVVALAQVVKSVPDNLSAGIFYWGAEYQALSGVNEAGFNTASFFDAKGNLLPAASVFGQMVAPVVLSAGLGGGGLAVQWPLSGAGMTLTTTSNLKPFASWLPVTNTVQNTGAIFNVTLPWDGSASRFYRLQSN